MARGSRGPRPRAERRTGPCGEGARPCPREGCVDRPGFVRPHGVQEAFTAAKARLEALQGDLDQERKAWHLLEGQAKAVEEQIAALGRDAEKLKESERARDALRVDLEVYDMLVNRVFHKRGVVMYAVEQLLPEL